MAIKDCFLAWDMLIFIYVLFFWVNFSSVKICVTNNSIPIVFLPFFNCVLYLFKVILMLYSTYAKMLSFCTYEIEKTKIILFSSIDAIASQIGNSFLILQLKLTNAAEYIILLELNSDPYRPTCCFPSVLQAWRRQFSNNNKIWSVEKRN